MEKLDLKQMEMVEGGATMTGCIGGSVFSVGLFVAGALASTVTTGAAAVLVIGLYGGIGFSCLT